MCACVVVATGAATQTFFFICSCIGDICYEVTASTSSEKLKLLNNVDGAFRAGTMTALMGTSGESALWLWQHFLPDLLSSRSRYL